MSEPIVNPLWFYLAGVCENIYGACFLFSLFCIIALLGVLIVRNTTHDKDEICEMKNIARRISYAFLTAIAVTTILPSRETIMSMVAASVITKENIKMTRDEIISLISDVRKAVTGMERERK